MVNLRAKEAERAAQMFRRQKAEGIDQSEMFFDNKDYQTSNSQVANILSVGKEESENKAEGETKETAPVEATADQLEA